MRLLDLFCGQGGASAGYMRAGFEVVGVDLVDQPRYPLKFARADALDFLCVHGREFDVIHASPPCQAFTAYRRKDPSTIGATALDLIGHTRSILRQLSVPYVIENVPGAPLEDPIVLCGSMFGLEVRRHRIFESNVPMLAPQCRHDLQHGDFPCAANRVNRRRTVEVGVWRIPVAVQARAMGISWMDREGLSQAIPPAYTEWLGGRLIAALQPSAVAL